MKKKVMKKSKDKGKKQALISRLVSDLKVVKKQKQREASKTRSEFRYNVNAKHPNYVFEVDTKKDSWRAIGITHEKETFGVKNAPLKVNPKKTDNRNAYLRNGVVSGNHGDFSKKPMKNMKFSKEDMPNVKAKIRNDKKKRKIKAKK